VHKSVVGTFPTGRDVRLESGMRVKPDVTAWLWVCPLGEQLSAGRGELQVCPGLMQPEPARCNRALDTGAVLIRP
jgi:hypothetical protein